jgi:uncharacterized phiE125 gp8 family phage protein
MDTIIFGTPQKPTATITPFRSLVRVVQPTVEPVSLAEAKMHCRVDTETDDIYIQALISTARQYVEDIQDITICSSVWEVKYDLFPVWAIVLPRMPLQASQPITITYRSGDGTYSTLSSANSDFQVDGSVLPGRVYPQWARAWPATRGDENSVTIRYSAGYGEGGRDAPPTLRHLMMLLVAHWYESRQPAVSGTSMPVPHTFDTLLAASSMGVYR